MTSSGRANNRLRRSPASSNLRLNRPTTRLRAVPRAPPAIASLSHLQANRLRAAATASRRLPRRVHPGVNRRQSRRLNRALRHPRLVARIVVRTTGAGRAAKARNNRGKADRPPHHPSRLRRPNPRPHPANLPMPGARQASRVVPINRLPNGRKRRGANPRRRIRVRLLIHPPNQRPGEGKGRESAARRLRTSLPSRPRAARHRVTRLAGGRERGGKGVDRNPKAASRPPHPDRRQKRFGRMPARSRPVGQSGNRHSDWARNRRKGPGLLRPRARWLPIKPRSEMRLPSSGWGNKAPNRGPRPSSRQASIPRQTR